MYCNNCGKEVRENWKFCKYCGESLNENVSKEKNKIEDKKNNEKIEEISNSYSIGNISNIEKVYREPIKRINFTSKDIEQLKLHLKNNCREINYYNITDENSIDNRYICKLYIPNELKHSPSIEYSIYFSPEKEYYFATYVLKSYEKQSNNKKNNKSIIVIFIIATIIGILTIGAPLIENSSGTGSGYSTYGPKDIAMAYVQNGMKDPSSFKVVDISVKELNNGTVVYIKYTAKNSFNALVTEEQNVYLNENNKVTGSMYVE